MLEPLNKEAAFASIAAELELPLVLLCNADPRVRLQMVDRIGAALLSTNLTFRDLAERVLAPRPFLPSPVPPSPSSIAPASEIRIEPDTAVSDPELQRLGGYRTGPSDPGAQFVEAELQAFGLRTGQGPSFGRYGRGSIPDRCETIPGESDFEAGRRLAGWSLAKSGQPFFEDPDTGEAHLPGVTVPGKGKVRSDGMLDPFDE